MTWGNSYQEVLGEVLGPSSAIAPLPNTTGIYTTASACEHADSGRTHRYCGAVFVGDLTNASKNDASVRAAPGEFPGAYNMVSRNPDELHVYFGVYGAVESAAVPTVALMNADTFEEVWRTTIKDFLPEARSYPEALSLHVNDKLYAVDGNVIAEFDPETGNIPNKRLPANGRREKLFV